MIIDSTQGTLSPDDIKTLIERSLDADKGVDIVTIGLDAQNGVADYIVIASGTSSRHVSAMANKVKERLQDEGLKGIRIDGIPQSDWVVVDAGDVIVHVFRPEVREFYNIEKMWSARPPAEESSNEGHASA